MVLAVWLAAVEWGIEWGHNAAILGLPNPADKQTNELIEIITSLSQVVNDDGW